MKKNGLMCLTTAFVCMVFIACSNSKYPFKDVSENIVDYFESVLKDPELMNDEDHFNTFFEKQKKLCKELEGKTIYVEVEKGIGFEIEEQQATIGCGTGESTISIPIDVKLKVVDAEKAYKNDLMVLVYDDKDIVYAKSLWNNDVDEEAVADVNVEEVADQTFENPYKVGKIINKRITISIDLLLAHQFVNVSKLIITKYDYDKISTISKKNEEIEEENRGKFKSFQR